jgi:hypothetical protein
MYRMPANACRTTHNYLLLLPPYRLVNLLMIRADVVTPSHEDDVGHDGGDVDALRNTHQKVSAKQAVGQK